MEFGSTTIAAIYRERWQIELFFKALKQNLTVKSFVGTSENALRIQIWTALIALLLLKWLLGWPPGVRQQLRDSPTVLTRPGSLDRGKLETQPCEVVRTLVLRPVR